MARGSFSTSSNGITDNPTNPEWDDPPRCELSIFKHQELGENAEKKYQKMCGLRNDVPFLFGKTLPCWMRSKVHIVFIFLFIYRPSGQITSIIHNPSMVR